MKLLRFLSFTFLLCFCSTIAFSAFAAEYIRFNYSVPMRVQKSITLFTQQNTAKNPEITPKNIRIAGTDLNEDGINEFIISTQDCPPPKKMCSYLILADKGRSMISLGRIKARYLSLANTYSHGIRDIQAYDNEKNDFDYKLYVWEPASSHYTVKDERP